MKKIMIIALAVVSFAVAGCDSYNDERGRGDAPVGERDEEPRLVIFMPDRFPNLAIWCDGSTAVVATTREAAPIAYPNSAHCSGGGSR